LRPRPGRALGLVERATRAREIALVVGRIYLGLRAQRWVEDVLGPPDMERRWLRQHEANARDLYRAATGLGGLILKASQFLGARADLLPPPYVERLGRLQDRVPPRPFAVMRRVVEHSFGRDLHRVFSTFDETPLAAASLAQVHAAVLQDGRAVAVKIQYPEMAALVRSDLANLRVLFGAIDWLERDFDLAPLLDELADTVPAELDFVHEAHNSERIARELAHRKDIVVPAVHWDHTTRRVLVMERIDGIPINDRGALLAAGVDPNAVAQTLAECFAEQMLVNGHFHADPHPGNLMVLPPGGGHGTRLALLDFGLTKELPDRFRETALAFGTALLQGQPVQMTDALVALGFETRGSGDETLAAIAEALRDAMAVLGRSGGSDPEALDAIRRSVSERLRANPLVRVPHHLVLVARAIGLLAGVNASLGVEIDLLATLAPYALGIRGGGA